MRAWIEEDWEFTLSIIKGAAEHCRIGLEAGDVFTFRYATPDGFCPKTMHFVYTLCEIIRCGGDFTHRGSVDPYSIDFFCADGVQQFRLTARRLI